MAGALDYFDAEAELAKQERGGGNAAAQETGKPRQELDVFDAESMLQQQEADTTKLKPTVDPNTGAEILDAEAALPPQVGIVKSFAGNVMQSLIGAFAGTPESIAVAAHMIGQEGDPTEFATYRFGQWMREEARKAFPTDPEAQGFWLQTIPQGLGSLVGFAAGGAAGKAVKLPAWFGSVFLGSTALGATEYQKAYNETNGDTEVAFDAWIRNLPVGASEAIPISRAFDRINKVTGGMLKKTKWLKALTGGLEEGLQEFMQGVATNWNAQQVYDAQRELIDASTGEESAAGFVLGLAANALGLHLQSLQYRESKVLEGDERLLAQVEGLASDEFTAREKFALFTIGQKIYGATGQKLTDLEQQDMGATEQFMDALKQGDIKGVIKSYTQLAYQFLPKDLVGDLSVDEVADNFVSYFQEGISSIENKPLVITMRQALGGTYTQLAEDPVILVNPSLGEAIDKLFGGTEYKTQAELVRWAQSQIDENELLSYLIEGKGDNPLGMPGEGAFVDPRAAAKAADEMMGPSVRKTVDPITGTISQSPIVVGPFRRLLQFPEYALSRLRERRKAAGLKATRAPEETSVAIMNGQLEIDQRTRDYQAWLAPIAAEIEPEKRPMVREFLKIVYQAQRTPSGGAIKQAKMAVEIQEAKNTMADMLAANPELETVLNGVTNQGGIIHFFEYMKGRYKEYLRSVIKNEMPEGYERIVRRHEETGMDLEASIDQEYDFALEAKNNWIKRRHKNLLPAQQEAEWNKLSAKKRKQLELNARKSTIKKIQKELTTYFDVENWGLDEYVTNLQLGNYKIIDAEGRTQGFAQTEKEAKRKAYEMRLLAGATDSDLWTIEPAFNRLNPTAKRDKNSGFQGEEDIFEVLPAYALAMEKRIILGPIKAKMRKFYRERPDEFSPDVQSVLDDQMKSAQGLDTDPIDQWVDAISVSRGWKTGKYKRFVGVSKSISAKLKLGYRMVTASMNYLLGMNNTHSQVGTEFMMKAKRYLTGEETYVGPDGVKVNILETLKRLERTGALHLNVAVDETGAIQSREPIWKPIGLFTRAEVPVRQYSYVANYLYEREVNGLNHKQAEWQALQNLRFAQTVYNMASIPKILRSPTGRLAGQFKTYMLNHVQFLSTLTPRQFVRYLGGFLALGGPKAMMATISSLPLLGSLGFINDAEEWMSNSTNPLAELSSGIPGLLGFDISKSVAYLVPQSGEEWVGPTIAELSKLWFDVIQPAIASISEAGDRADAPGYLGDRAVDWVTGLSPVFFYMKDLFQSVTQVEEDEELKKLAPNEFRWETSLSKAISDQVWIRDSHGDKAYLVNGSWDRLLLLAGAAPLQKARGQKLKQVWYEKMEVRKDNRKRWLDRVVKKMVNGQELNEDDANDAWLYGINPSVIPNRLQWAETPPAERAVMKAAILDRLDAKENFDSYFQAQ